VNKSEIAAKEEGDTQKKIAGKVGRGRRPKR